MPLWFHSPFRQFEAESLVRGEAGRLPVQIFRPSIVVGERDSGWTASFNVLYAPLRAFSRGLYAAVPAVRSALRGERHVSGESYPVGGNGKP